MNKSHAETLVYSVKYALKRNNETDDLIILRKTHVLKTYVFMALLYIESDSKSPQRNMERWENHVAVVTGASSGIGASIFENLALAGFIVIGVARRVNLIQAIINNQTDDVSSRMYAQYCDVRIPESVDATFEYINSTFGGIDVLINDAGIIRPGNLITMDLIQIHNVIQTNLFGYIYWARKAAASLTERNAQGHIILIDSTAGQFVPRNKGFSINAYSISKFGVTALRDVLIDEFNLIDNRNIKVTVSFQFQVIYF